MQQLHRQTHLASTPVSLCRGLFLEDKVVVNGKDQPNMGKEPALSSTPSFQKKPSMDDGSGLCTLASTEYSSSAGDISTFGDQESLNESFSEFLKGTHSTIDVTTMSDQDLLLGIEVAADSDKLVLVSKYLREMKKRNLKLQDPKRQATLVENTRMIDEVILQHKMTPEADGWKKQGIQHHGKQRNSIIYHKLDQHQNMKVRVEMPIEESLVIPLLSVLNETDHYKTWIPSFQRPVKLGMRRSKKLQQTSRCSQIAMAQLDMPWPMNNRELVVTTIVAEAVDEVGSLVVRGKSLDEGVHDGCVIPPCPKNWDRIALDGGIVIRKCPKDHPALLKRQKENKEPLFLFSIIAGVKPSINFITRTVCGPLWAALVSVAEEIRDGKRPVHKDAIASNPELYGWIQETMDSMNSANMG